MPRKNMFETISVITGTVSRAGAALPATLVISSDRVAPGQQNNCGAL